MKKPHPNLFKMYLFTFFASLTFFGALSVPYFLDWIQVDYTKIFLLQAWFMGWMFLLEVPMGVIADRYGRKVSLSLGAACAAGSMLIFGFTHSYAVLFIAEFFGALANALFTGADEALIYDSLVEAKSEKEAKRVFTNYQAASTLGMVIAFPVGSYIAGSSFLPYPQALPLTFILTAAAVVVALVILLLVREPKRHKPVENPMRTGVEGFRYIFHNRKLRLFALNSALITATTFFIYWLYQPALGAAGADVMYYGFVAAGFNLLAWIALLILPKIEKYVSPESLLLYTAIVPGVIFLLLAFTRNVVLVVLFVVLVAVLKALRQPSLSDFMNRHIESKRRATVLSGISMIQEASIFVLYPIVGILADFSLDATFLFLGLLTVFLAFMTRIEAKELE